MELSNPFIVHDWDMRFLFEFEEYTAGTKNAIGVGGVTD
jgi:hypothetical protein